MGSSNRVRQAGCGREGARGREGELTWSRNKSCLVNRTHNFCSSGELACNVKQNASILERHARLAPVSLPPCNVLAACWVSVCEIDELISRFDANDQSAWLCRVRCRCWWFSVHWKTVCLSLCMSVCLSFSLLCCLFVSSTVCSSECMSVCLSIFILVFL